MLRLFLLFLIISLPLSTMTSAQSSTEVDELLKKAYSSINATDYNKAIQYFDQVLEIDPKNTKALNLKGALLGKISQSEDAIPYFDRVLEIDPKNIQALSNKGAALLELNKTGDAMKYFDKVLEIDPNDAPALSNKGVALLKLNKTSDALKYFDKTLEIDSKNSVAIKYKKLALKFTYLKPISNANFTTYLQMEVRDEEGRLVVYRESNDIHYYDGKETYKFLNEQPTQKIVKDGKNYEQIRWVNTLQGDAFGIVSKNSENIIDPYTNATITLFSDVHSGVTLDKGDVMTLLWTVIRPVI